MEAVTYTNLKQNLNGWIDKVIQDQNPLVVTRENGKNVVLISIDVYNDWKSKVLNVENYDGDTREEIIANLKQAAKDIKMIREGKLEGRPVEELFNEL